MIILGIETSCDETALSLIEISDSSDAPSFEVKVLANQVLSQIELHKQYGGVFPNLAKREHGKNLVPLLKTVLKESGFFRLKVESEKLKGKEKLEAILEREQELSEQFLKFIPTVEKPPIDLIAVTAGPGLEPALWVGINFAKALSYVWNIPVVPTNHMEGHILVSLMKRNKEFSILPPSWTSQSSAIFQFSKRVTQNVEKSSSLHATRYTLDKPSFPALALLISGGHTELVLMKSWGKYEIVGKTRDDAIGEAFDKVARVLGLPYPGGPQISALAEIARTNADQTQTDAEKIKLPRPMIKSDNLDFSFSGLKTAVLYLVQKLTQTDSVSVGEGRRPVSLSLRLQSLIAREFEDAVTEVIVGKAKKAIDLYGIKTLILGGGVVANKNIRTAFETVSAEEGVALKLPSINHATDNALMIALAGYANKTKAQTESTGLLDLKADGNLHF
ncbi:MAG: tRNA (adenosine(37)-N6)-threonylcarbamoyltransferase complex transferase subunit TsaD [Candidatus Taylorbacteria bacterium]|nr:tRNA (adenosine(37)-N6)-threonylcarbamoyltransferase complex transferase subunit TsaD [Candidatus Taylorbacteria bacterium]